MVLGLQSAERFAKSQGWDYETLQPQEMTAQLKVKQYGDNFSVKRKGFPIDPRGD